MIEDHRHRQPHDVALERGDHRQVRVDLDMPVAAGELRRGRGENAFGGGRIILAGGLEVEANATHARARQLIEHRGGDRFVDDGDPAGARAELANRIDGAGIVDAVDARRHDHHPLEVERALQATQIIDRGLRRRIEPAGEIRKMHRIEDVHVAIARAARDVEIDRCLDGRGRGGKTHAGLQGEARGPGGADMRQHPTSGEHDVLPVAPLVRAGKRGHSSGGASAQNVAQPGEAR